MLRRRPPPGRPAPPPRQTTPPPPRPAAPKPRRKRRWGRRLVAALLLGAVLAGVSVVAGGAWVDTSLHRSPVLTGYPDRPPAGRGTTWLLVGSDSRQGLTAEQQAELTTGGDLGNGRTDTILLVHVAAGPGGATTMVSLPRDSYVPIPGYGRDKINAAYAMGGAPLLAQTVEQATGLRLDHYAEIGFSGFAALVDALGGVTVCPSEPITDPLAGIDLAPGCQRLDGRTALGFVRTRATPRADLDRMVHQRLFMAALLGRLTDPTVWLNPRRWYTVPRAGVAALSVDRDDHVWDLARLAWALHGATTTLTVPIGEFTDSDAGAVVVWNHQAAAELFDALAADAPLPPDVFDGQP
nr:LCP family protein [Mycobacterium eburneum]